MIEQDYRRTTCDDHVEGCQHGSALDDTHDFNVWRKIRE